MKENFNLNDIPKHNIYQVPEHYFERLPMRVMERTAVAAAKAERSNAIWQPIRMAVAPVVLLLVFIGAFYTTIPSDKATGNLEMASLQDQEIMDYLSTYATLESADFAELQSLEEQELTAEFLNVSATNAEAELEYHNIKNIDY